MIIETLQKLTGHNFVKIVDRGNTAISAAVSLVNGSILIPQEGGWLSYKKINGVVEVMCRDAVIDLTDLEEKLKVGGVGCLLYQNPGGYFAEQLMQKIYAVCRKYNCLVVLDVSGSLGTEMCDGKYANVIVGSFGKWKLVEAHGGGFISCKDKELFEKINVDEFTDEETLLKIEECLNDLSNRIMFLRSKVERAKSDLKEFEIVHKEDNGFVVVVKFSNGSEKEKIINYCQENGLEWTECPRYIRLLDKAISIEVKRLRE